MARTGSAPQRVEGDATLRVKFQNAPAGSTLRMLGQYMGDDYLLAEIDVGAPGTPPAAK